MSNLNKLNGWAGKSEYNFRSSAQSYMLSDTDTMTSSGYGSSCGSKDGDDKPAPSTCGSSCGSGESH
jgi:hypothetical protein